MKKMENSLVLNVTRYIPKIFSQKKRYFTENFFQKINGEAMDCKMCGGKVEGEIIRAVGFVFHPNCFKCCICGINLSNREVPFTTDEDNRIYCQNCYNQ